MELPEPSRNRSGTSSADAMALLASWAATHLDEATTAAATQNHDQRNTAR
ncbi:hypothetical protein [Salinifilum aidingensis]